MSCPHRFDVAVYVLGALEPGERDGFEAHLPGCADCARSLNEVAGLPGLLARAPTHDDPDPQAPHAPEPVPPPADLLDLTLRRVRRRRWTARAVAAVAVVLALVGGFGVAAWSGASSSSSPGASPVRSASSPCHRSPTPRARVSPASRPGRGAPRFR